jgi:hypothetical protein
VAIRLKFIPLEPLEALEPLGALGALGALEPFDAFSLFAKCLCALPKRACACSANGSKRMRALTNFIFAKLRYIMRRNCPLFKKRYLKKILTK